MKEKTVTSIILCLIFLLGGCTRVGGQDSIDFLAALESEGYVCTVDETYSTEEVTECCYVSGCKISMFSNQQGKLKRITLTYSGVADAKTYLPLAEACIKSMCEYSGDEAKAVLKSLGIASALPGSTNGVTRSATQWFFFSFSSQKPGGMLQIDSLRLNPTTAPTVTIRTTVPSPEKAEPSS